MKAPAMASTGDMTIKLCKLFYDMTIKLTNQSLENITEKGVDYDRLIYSDWSPLIKQIRQ